MTFTAPFDNSYADLPAGFYTRQDPTPVRAPKRVAYNSALATLLRLPDASEPELTAIFSGQRVPLGADPLAQLYAGHQFGSYNPQLGDGRAVLLGETIGTDGIRRDIQLKGSGPTPYSRRGDGRAWLGPVLREYVISEAMHALGVPTTRALAATLTGEDIYRETALPGAVLARVAQSHLRVGTFQVFAHRGQNAELSQLTQYAIDRHDPGAKTPMDLLRAVCARQADLVAAWMSVGFIHGVMNTDNCTISGETIDYGPCAFIDDYHEDTVFSSIDRTGRYAYSNQRHVIVWNMAQFATALLQQLDDPAAGVEEATAIIDAMPGQIDAAWLARFGAKVGLTSPGPDDATLIQDLLTLMQNDGADFTNTFDALARGDARDQFVNRARFDRWSIRWQDRLCDEPAPQNTMQAASPRVIPRNHRIEDMIAAAVAGDFAPFDRLMTALADPYGTDDLDLMHPPTKAQRVPATFCGT